MTTDSGDFKVKTDNFVNWLKERKVEISPKIAVHDYRSAHQGRGVIALEDIEEGEVLFTIPRSSILAVDSVNPELTPEISKLFKESPLVKQLDTWMALILYMMIRIKDDEFRPYYDVLPQKLNTLMYWDEKEVKELLKGSTVVDRIGKEGAEESYHNLLKPIFEENKEFFKDIDTSIEQYHRMGSLIMAYSFDVEKVTSEENEEEDEDEDEEEDETVKAMVPLADILNAHTRLCNANLFHEDGFLEMRAIKPIPANTQVYNTYGDLPNSDLLRRYGYVETGGNEFDVTEIKTESILEAFIKIFNSEEEKEDSKKQITLDFLKQGLETLESWQEEADYFSPEGEWAEFVDDSYDIPVTGIAPIELQVLISFLVLYVLDHVTKKKTSESLFLHHYKDSKAATIDGPEDKTRKKRMRHKLLKLFVKNAKGGKKSKTHEENEEGKEEEEEEKLITPIMFKESLPVYRTICESRKQDYSPEIVEAAKQNPNPSQVEDVFLTHEEMAKELLTGEVRILDRLLNAVSEASKESDNDSKYLVDGHEYLSKERERLEAEAKERKAAAREIKKKRQGEDGKADKKKKRK